MTLESPLQLNIYLMTTDLFHKGSFVRIVEMHRHFQVHIVANCTLALDSSALL